MAVSIQVKGLEETIAGLGGIGKIVGPPLMLLLGKKMQEQAARTFAGQFDPVTLRPWPQTSGFTLSLRASGGGQSMRATSGLFNSIVSSRPIVTASTVAIGTNKLYASVLQGEEGVPFYIMRPKGGRFLAIPADRKAARFAAGRSHWVRAWFAANPDGKWFWGRRGPWGFGTLTRRGSKAKGISKGDQVVAGYLKESVNIPRRRFLGIGAVYGAELEAVTIRFIEALVAKGAVT
jgi:hypothetical protein